MTISFVFFEVHSWCIDKSTFIFQCHKNPQREVFKCPNCAGVMTFYNQKRHKKLCTPVSPMPACKMCHKIYNRSQHHFCPKANNGLKKQKHMKDQEKELIEHERGQIEQFESRDHQKYSKTMVQKRRKLNVEFEGGRTKFKCRHECGKRLNHSQSVRNHERNVSSMCSLINFLKDS